MPKGLRRILLVRLSHLGDVVHALPVFHALRAAHPEAELAWAVQREFAGLLRGLPGLARVIEFDRRGGARAWFALQRELAAFRADWSIDAQGNVKSAAAALVSGARVRTGLARADWRERAGAWLVNDRAPSAAGPHAIERMEALVRHVAGPRAALRFDPALSPEELARDDDGEPRAVREADVLLHLATPGDVRAWPPERFAELARELAARGKRVLVVSGPAEEELGRALARELDAPDVAHWVGQRGLRRLARAFTLGGARGAAFVGCDSGPMHLAWACGLRVVCLAGPQDARRTGPWPVPPPVRGDASGPRHAVVRARDEPACAPCLARRCTHAEGPVCMRRVASEDVIAALESFARGA